MIAVGAAFFLLPNSFGYAVLIVIPLELAIAICFPFLSMSFIVRNQQRWRGSKIGDVGSLLTVTWVALWADYLLFCVYAATLG